MMPRWSRSGFVLVLLSLLLGGPAWAQDARRVALVIGNGTYEHSPPLRNPPNDARAVAAKLRGLGFDVVEAVDADQARLRNILAEFARRLEGASAGLFFYAGHGLQVSGRNYLVPTDARLEREVDLYFQVVTVDDVLRIMEAAVPTRLVILDACRDNPLARTLARSMSATRSQAVGQGLARIDAAVGTLIAYATAPGEVALDGRGANSPFTAALVEHLDTPGLEVSQMLRKVRGAVLAATQRRQVPWDSSSLESDFYFKPLPAEPAPPPAPDTTALDLGLWAEVKDSRDPADFEEYLRQFPNGLRAGLARNRLAELRRQPQAALPVAPTPQPEPTRPVPPPVTPSPEQVEAALGLAREDWRLLQQALTALGFDTKGVDGKPGPGTRKAVAAWQAGKRQEATGFLTGLQRDLVLAEAQPRLAAVPVATSPPPEPPKRAEPPRTGDAARRPGEVFKDCAECPEMVVVPAGSFLMGSPEGEAERGSAEGPQHRVTIARPFAVGRYEVTRGQFARFVAEAGHKAEGRCWVWTGSELKTDAAKSWRAPGFEQGDDHPVVCVSWPDAQAYVAWLSEKTGQPYRLLSEAEWEYAARGITDGRAGPRYPWGEDAAQGCAFANGADLTAKAKFPNWTVMECRDGQVFTARVGSYRENAFKLHDTIGNVWEWVEDCWHGSYQGAPVDGSPWTGQCSGTRRVVRGGSWFIVPWFLRSADRNWYGPEYRLNYLGFRVSRMLTP